MEESEPELPLNDPKVFLASIYVALMRSVFPATFEAILQELAGTAFASGHADDSFSEARRLVSKAKDDAFLRYILLEIASPAGAMQVHGACEYFLKRLTEAPSHSEFFQRESGMLMGEMSVLYMARRALSMLAKGDEGQPHRSVGIRQTSV
jgi:hypothetical protein